MLTIWTKCQGSVGHRSFINEWSTAKKAKCVPFYLDRLGTQTGTYFTIGVCQKSVFPSIRM